MANQTIVHINRSNSSRAVALPLSTQKSLIALPARPCSALGSVRMQTMEELEKAQRVTLRMVTEMKTCPSKRDSKSSSKRRLTAQQSVSIFLYQEKGLQGKRHYIIQKCILNSRLSKYKLNFIWAVIESPLLTFF